jgi:hypothetical protein
VDILRDGTVPVVRKTSGSALVAMIGRLGMDRAATWIAYALEMLNPTTSGAFLGLLLAAFLVATRRENMRCRLTDEAHRSQQRSSS